MENEEQTLKPCPFCGHKAIFENEKIWGIEGSVRVICSKCRATIRRSKSKKEAIERWNTRINNNDKPSNFVIVP